ncbi:MAG: hypothetical protein LUG99_09795 [Lachnospiraceae bacterium]|nr:hypothetical protein [Lachnospiraceae bacterium]
MKIYKNCLNRPFDDLNQKHINFDTGNGDYTKEKQERPDINHKEAVTMIMQKRNAKQPTMKL